MGTALNNNLDALFGKFEGFVSTKTVVGEPTNIGGVIIVPLIEVSFGLAAGANENTPEEKKKQEGSVGGMGAKITPSAVLVIMNGAVQLVNVKNQDSLNKLIDMVPGVLSKLNFGSWFGKKDKDKDEDEKETEAAEFSDIIITEDFTK